MKLALLLLLAACGPKKGMTVDPTLPESDLQVERREPAQVLASGADSDDPNVRARALAHLILTTPDHGDWSRRALYDPDAWVQHSGMVALSERIDEPATVTVLEEYVRAGMSTSDPYVRGAAALRLARAGHTAVREDVAAAWRAEKQAWRAAPLQLAAAFMGDTDALEPLARTLSRGQLAMETDFVLDIGESGLEALLPALKEGSDWVEEELVLPYAVARVSLGDASGEGALRKAVTGDEEILQLEALDYLSRLDDPAATTLLRKASGQGSELVRAYAELALVGRGDGDLGRVERAFASEDREIRALAVRFVVEAAQRDTARRTERLARRVVREGLSDGDAVVRTAALRNSAAVGLTRQDEALVARLGDEYMALRVEAAGALLMLAR